MDKVIVVTSGKGGVGKSTIAANLACALANGHRRILLIDMDTGLRSLDLMLGMENELVFDLNDVLCGYCTSEQAMFEDKHRKGLFLMPASQNTASAALAPGDIKAFIDSLRDEFDLIILDCPAGIERGFRNAVSVADRAILIVTPDYISLRSGERAYQLACGEGIKHMDLIINRIGRHPAVSTDECVHRMELNVLGFIPDDPHVSACMAAGKPVVDSESPAGDALERISRRLLGEQVRYRIPHASLIHNFRTHFGKESCSK